MITLASLIHAFEAPYLAQYGHTMLPSQAQALTALKRCRTRMAAQMLAQCEGCGEQRLAPHSCGHRSCPHCQAHEGQRWIEQQTQRLVPGPYFLITFTLPSELRELVWQHQRVLYAALMECTWATLRQFSLNDRHLHGEPGAVAVLHTHSRRLEFHPHVHVLMPGAALDAKHRLWRCLRKGKSGNTYLFNHQALAKVFRGKFLQALAQCGLTTPSQAPRDWVVDCKRVGNGQGAIVYLGRYLYRGVIQERDIISCQDGQVTFRYRDSASGQTRLRSVDGAQFLCLILRHVLPKGFRRSRNYGFFHPNSKRMLALLQLLVFKLTPKMQGDHAEHQPSATRPCWQCGACGGMMTLVRRRMRPGEASTLKRQCPAAAQERTH